MAKKTDYYVCSACGTDFSKWNGRCSVCGEWNTIIEKPQEVKTGKSTLPEAVPLSSIGMENLDRIVTGNSEFDLVCGGGIVPGSVILLGGEPGIGKSTLALQISQKLRALYISGEESPAQIRQRGDRISIDPSKVNISVNNEVDDIITLVHRIKPGCLIVDSIQTVYNSELPVS